MRFIKIFLACFFSLIGVVSGSLGIMYLAGSFNREIVEPTNIYFEKNNYYVDGDFTIKILSTTEGVTETTVTLSLENQIGEAVGGKITDGKITIPETVYLDRSFSVEVLKEYSEELGKEWIIGGVSNIIASSESDRAIDVNANVYIDVPVDAISVVTYSNDETQTETSTFALGESFYAEAVFSPSNSLYKYSTAQTKRVFFDISANTSGSIAENQEMITAMQEAGKPYIYGFDVIKALNGVDVKAYCFNSAVVEEDYTGQEGITENELISVLINTTNGIQNTQVLNFTNRTVGEFSVSDIAVTNTLKTNTINKIFANNASNLIANFGIQIKGSDDSLLQNKIADVGVRAFVMEGGQARAVRDDELIFVNNASFDFAPSLTNTGAYFYNSATSEYLAVVNGDTYETTYNKYYFPRMVASNVDNSYWSVVPVASNITVYFEAYLFENNDTIEIEEQYRAISTPQWASTEATVSELNWIDESDVDLIFIDSNIGTEQKIAEYLLSSNLRLLNTNATYTTVKYLVYSADADISTFVQNITATTMYDLSEYAITEELYELSGPLLSASKDGVANIVAVIIKTDYLGRPVVVDGKYQICAISTSNTGLEDYKNLVVNVSKTIQDLSASIEVNDLASLKNTDDAIDNEMDKLAFVQNQSTSVFKINLTITADETTTIEKEKSLFIDAWNNGKIYFKAYKTGDIESFALSFENTYTVTSETEDSWTISFDAYTTFCETDTELYIKYFYEKTTSISTNEYISQVVFSGDLSGFTYNPSMNALIEVYDGKVSNVEFGVETSDSDKLTKYYTIVKGEEYTDGEETKYYATDISILYENSAEENVTDTVVNEDGSYIMTFYDKYNNEVTLAPTDYELTLDGSNVVITITNYSSSLYEADQPTATLYVVENNVGTVLSTNYNIGDVNDGVFVDEFGTFTLSNNSILNIQRFGAKASVINLTGRNGLLNIEFEDANSDVFELCNIINYTIYTSDWNNVYADWETTYDGVLTLSEDGSYITIEKSINNDIKINLLATTGLGERILIELTIKPNISATFTLATEQAGATTVSDPFEYKGIYSDNDVEITVSYTLHLFESFSLTCPNDENGNTFTFKDVGKTIAFINTLNPTATFTVNFDIASLGKNIVFIKSGTTDFDFKQSIYLNVNANLQLKNAEDRIIYLPIEISALNTDNPVLSGEDLERIVASYEIDLSEVSLEFAKVVINNVEYDNIYSIDTNGNEVLNINNIFEIYGFNIKAIASLTSNYKVMLNVDYGNAKIGSIVLTISSNMGVDSTAESFEQYFANYNGKLHLVLLSATTYDYEQIIPLFENIDSISFDSSIVNNAIYKLSDVGSYTIEVQTIKTYSSLYCLHLISSIGNITFPVLFSPLPIGFVQYNVDTAIDPTKTEETNNDIAKLNNKTNIIDNQIFDVYDSGRHTSLSQTNYTISLNETAYTFKNYTNESIFVLAYTNGGYYYNEFDSISNANQNYSFDLTSVPTGWTKITDESIISSEYLTTETSFIGAFSAINVIDETTFIPQDREFGLSLDIFERVKAGLVSVNIYDEVNGEIGTIRSTYATFDNDYFLLKPQIDFSTLDRFVWVVVTDNSVVVAKYRVVIEKNSALNIYYPYGDGLGISTEIGVESEQAEYIYLDGSNYTIDFNSPLGVQYPNSIQNDITRRVMLQRGSELTGWQTALDATIIFTPFMISVGGVDNYETSTFINHIIFSDNVLTIKYTDQVLVIYLKAKAQIGGQDIGAEVIYKIFVNYNLKDYYLINNIGEHDEYNATTESVDCGGSYQFSDIVLYNGITQEEGLKYYIYTTEDKDLSDFVTFDLTEKVLYISEGVNIVSDLKVHFVYYTIYGVVLDTEITFISSLVPVFNDTQTVVQLVGENSYSVYADVPFDLTSIFEIQDNGYSVGATSEYWKFSIDNGVTYTDGDSMEFTQNQVGNYVIKIIVRMSDIDSVNYIENYNFEFNLQVKQSLKSNYTSQDGAYTLNANGIVYSSLAYEVNNTIYIDNMTANIGYLFSTQSIDVINQYDLTAFVQTGNDFVSITSDLAANLFTLNFVACPTDSTMIVIWFKLTKDDVIITAYITFSLIPDVVPEASYPEADPDSTDTYTFEAYYLDGDYINHSTENNVWNSVGSDYASLSLSETSIFGGNRLKLLDNDGNEIIDSIKLAEIATRIKIVVSAVNITYGNLVIAYDNGEELVLNNQINLEQAVAYSDYLFVKWVGSTAVSQNQTGDITFAIYIDDIYRTDYTIKFYSNIQQIFSAQFNLFNETKAIDADSAEIFYVLNENTEKIFSNQTAILHMTFKSTVLSSTPTVLTAYVNQKADANKVGEISVNNSITTADWILKGTTKISLENLIISIGENDYLFNEPTNANSIYKTYLQQDGCSLINRLVVNYLGNQLSYENYKNYTTVGATAIENYSIYKGNAQAIDVKNTVNIMINGEIFGTYFYTLVYDFNIEEESEFTSFVPQFTVGGDDIDVFDTYGITHYNGDEYTGDYFVNTNVTVNAHIILITKIDFDNNQTTDNIVYYNADKASYCNIIKAGLTSTKTTWIDYVELLVDQEEGKTKQIYIKLNGAENNGNYVYVLVTYKADGVSANEAYAIVKLKISPNWEYSFLSDLNSTNQNQEENNPLRVYYNALVEDSIDNITLINANSTTNYISLFRSGTTTNLALSGAFNTFELVGDIADYLMLDLSTSSLILKKGTNVAEYGNKSGYILIADKYGYQQKYYIELVAQSENPLSLTGQIINSVNDTNTNIYESSTISIVDSSYDEEVSGAITTNYAFKIDNLDNLAINGYTYKVSYVIDEIGLVSENHDIGEPSTYNTGYIPAQSLSLYSNNLIELNLKIILEITNGTITEYVTLHRSFNLLKRFETTGAPDVVVRDGQSFNVADYINITDNNADENLGAIALTGKIFTLVVDESYLGSTLTINVLSGGQNYANVNVIIGKDHNNAIKTATGGKYYYPLNLFTDFASIANYEYYTYSVYGETVSQTLAMPTDTVPTGEAIYLIKDKCLSIVTSNNNPTEHVDIALNNGPYKVLIPFALNYDGKQNKSIYEAITNLVEPAYPVETLLQNIYNYELDSNKISTADLQLLKGISIYNETLTLKIDEGMLDKYYNVKVYYDGANYKETGSIKINYNYAHFVYISLYNILGKDLGLNEEGVYKIEVIYAIGNIPSGTQNLYISKIDIEGWDLTPLITVVSNAYVYTLTLEAFEIKELEINVESQMFEDSISVLTAQDFIDQIKSNVNKYYLVKYVKDDVVYAVSVNYSVTPKYYTVDDNGNTSGADKKIVYANQYTLLYNSQEDYYYYEIDFDVWSNAYNLLDKNGKVITTVKDAKDDLVFNIQSEEGSGAAILDENNKIVTTSTFTEQHTVKIAVYVKVYKDKVADIYDWVYIDTIEVSISKDTLYVPVAGNYNIIITTTINGRLYSINIQHNFVSTTETIANLIATNTNLESLVNVNGEIGFATSDSMIYVSPSNCDFSVVNVINDIYSATYDGSNLNIKINLDETQNSIGKEISLQAVGRGITNTDLLQESNIFKITVGYTNEYTLTASIGETFLGTFTKADGYFTVVLELSQIFTEVFVGTDYSYSVNIIEILNNDTLTIVYSNDDVQANLNNTLFFHIAYTDSNDNSGSEIIGLKYTTDKQNYSGDYGYAIDVSSLMLENIVNYTVTFLGGFDLQCINGNTYNLLVTIIQSSTNTQYSIAYATYSDTSIFKVSDYGDLMKYLPSNDNNSIVIYEETVNGTPLTSLTPTILKLSSEATADKTYYYGVYSESVSNMDMFGLSTSGTDLYINVSAYSAFPKVIIKNCNTAAVSLSGEILPLFDSATEAITYWKSTINATTFLYTKTNITKTTFTKDTTTMTILAFDITPGLEGSAFASSVLITENTNIIDLTSISGTVDVTYTYTFELFQNNISLGNIEINGDQLTTVNIATLLGGLGGSFDNGNYKFVYISFDDNIPD